MKGTSARMARSAIALAAALFGMTGLGALTIKSIQAPAALTYSPDQSVQTTSRVRIWHDGYSGSFGIVFTEISFAPAPATASQKLSYGLYYPDTAPTYRLSLGGNPSSASEMIVGYFPPPSETKKPYVDAGFAVIVSPSTMPAAGTYTATIRADLYHSGYPVTGAPVDSLSFSVVVTVPSIADLSIVPKGSAFSASSTSATLSFGVMSAGESRDVDLLVRSNVRYSVSLSSASGGALREATSGETIPYTMTANGVPLALSAGSVGYAALNADPTFGVPKVYALAATIGSFSRLPMEGTYTDLITVNVLGP
jgi:hypothetical protein